MAPREGQWTRGLSPLSIDELIFSDPPESVAMEYYISVEPRDAKYPRKNYLSISNIRYAPDLFVIFGQCKTSHQRRPRISHKIYYIQDFIEDLSLL